MRRRRLPAALLLGAAGASLAVAGAGAIHADAAWARSSSLPGLGSGRIWSLASSPRTAGLVVAGTDHGVYVTLDTGAHWTATPLHAVRAWTVGFDARDPSRLFAGTDGSGVYLSTDSGASWSNVSTGLRDRTVRTLAFGLDGIAAGTNHGVALSPNGTSWHDGGLDQYSISSLAVAANAPSLVLVAATDRGDLSNGYLFRYGASASGWQTLQSGLPSGAVVTSVAAGPLSSSVPKRPLLVTTSKGAFRSGDGGSTWTASTGVAENLTLTTAVFSPLDPSLVYAGADQGGSNGGDLLRSTDSGSSFTVADSGLPARVREVESLTVEQTTPPTVVAALDPASGGQTFSQIDATAPAPPPLVAEAPGLAIPALLATPSPTPRPSATAVVPTRAAGSDGGVGTFLGSAFHWPVPLVFEVLLVLSVAYLLVRWRQRFYVEGPP
ncbi:MAG: hypothetical protein ACRENL_06150 [Candidatus Dormibacteria bacterium]